MTEWHLLDPSQPFPFTREWYAGRGRAPHLEQPVHNGRFSAAQALIERAVTEFGCASVVDLGCGDGGTLSLIKGLVPSWGYDLMPDNVSGALRDRGVDVRFADFLIEDIEWADLVVMTEVLEHLEDPHAMVRRVSEHARFFVASSPSRENPEFHDGCHAWAWDTDGYRALIEQGPFTVVEQRVTDDEFGFQVVLGCR